jgi:predicted metal-dependent phosphotriesterase family hydrolase
MAEVATVRGPVAADKLGRTLPHEHLFIDLARVTRNFDHFLHDVPLAVLEATRFRDAGGGTIVDLTNRNLGRDPRRLCAIAEQTGLNIVMGCGWYREPYYDRDVYEKSTNQLADEIVADIIEGVDGTGIRAGIIGEIGSDDRRPISPAEERSFRAAARAQKRTGVTISTHAAFSRVGLDQLDLLMEEGVDPSRVIIGHAGHMSDPDYHAAIAGRGAWVQFDRIRGMHEWDVRRYVELIQEFLNRGFLHQLLLSHDVCMLPHLRAYGGTGYDFLLTDFVEHLRGAGLSQGEIDTLLIDNPRAALAP